MNPFKKEEGTNDDVRVLKDAIEKIKQAIEELRGLKTNSQVIDTTSVVGKISGFGYIQGSTGAFLGSPLPIHQPLSWTSTRTGTGDYTITHNIGNQNYIPLIMAYTSTTSNSYNVQITSVNQNTFRYQTTVNGATPIDVDTVFTVLTV